LQKKDKTEEYRMMAFLEDHTILQRKECNKERDDERKAIVGRDGVEGGWLQETGGPHFLCRGRVYMNVPHAPRRPPVTSVSDFGLAV
jgi:hypothetical protein